VIRSATQVTADVLAAGTDLVVVGRAGIGLDNVDVAEATRRGVMVVNAPQSNILSAAEHTMALLLAQARNVPQANADLRAGSWNRSKWEGVELHGKTLGIVGLGRVGVLVAQRAHAFGMRLVAYDPFVSGERARQLGVHLVDSMNELVAASDFSRSIDEDARHRRPRERRGAGAGQARDAADQRRPGRDRRRGRAGRCRPRRPDGRRGHRHVHP
jgi:D-3-phosphoglycerate dehydrogenase